LSEINNSLSQENSAKTILMLVKASAVSMACQGSISKSML